MHQNPLAPISTRGGVGCVSFKTLPPCFPCELALASNVQCVLSAAWRLKHHWYLVGTVSTDKTDNIVWVVTKSFCVFCDCVCNENACNHRTVCRPPGSLIWVQLAGWQLASLWVEEMMMLSIFTVLNKQPHNNKTLKVYLEIFFLSPNQNFQAIGVSDYGVIVLRTFVAILPLKEQSDLIWELTVWETIKKSNILLAKVYFKKLPSDRCILFLLNKLTSVRPCRKFTKWAVPVWETFSLIELTQASELVNKRYVGSWKIYTARHTVC